MKRALTLAAAALAAAAASALAATSISGTYTTTISGAKPAALNGNWTIVFAKGRYEVAKGAQPVVIGTDSISGHTLTLHDMVGPAKCAAPNATGTYTFTQSGSTLTLKVAHDGCAPRRTILASHPLRRY